MARTVGLVKSVENGVYYVRNAQGEAHQLKAGEAIRDGDHVYGAYANGADAKIVIDVLLSGAGDLVIGGDGALQLSAPFLAGIFSNHDAVIHVNSMKEGLDLTASTKASVSAVSPDEVVATEETAAGDETAAGEEVTNTEYVGDTFSARDGAITDVTTDLRTTVPGGAGITAEGSEILLTPSDTSPVTDVVTLSDAVGIEGEIVLEGNYAVIQATVNSPVTGSPLVIVLDNGATITIPVGATSGISTPFLVPNGEDVYIDPGSYTVGISSTSGGAYDQMDISDTALVSVGDTIDTTTVSLSGPASVEEGSTATYTVSVNHAPEGDLTLNVTLTHINTETGDIETYPAGTVTILSGQHQAIFSVVIAQDMFAEGTESYQVSVSLPATPGGNYEHLEAGSVSVETVIADDDRIGVKGAVSDDDDVRFNIDAGDQNDIAHEGAISGVAASETVEVLFDTAGVTSGGEGVVSVWDSVTKTLTVSTVQSEAVVFTLRVNADNTGYTFTQSAPIDHLPTLQGETENELLNFTLQVSGVGSEAFSVSVNDDAPTVTDSPYVIVPDNDGNFSENGFLTDAVVSNDITSVTWSTEGLPTYYVNGQPLVFSTNGNVLTGSIGDTVYITLTIDPSTLNDAYNPAYSFAVTGGDPIGVLTTYEGAAVVKAGNVDMRVLGFGEDIDMTLTSQAAGGSASTVNTNANYIGIGNNWIDAGEKLFISFTETASPLEDAHINEVTFHINSQGGGAYSFSYVLTGMDADGNLVTYNGNYASSGNGDVVIAKPDNFAYITDIELSGVEGSFRIGMGGIIDYYDYTVDVAFDAPYTLTDADGDTAGGVVTIAVDSNNIPIILGSSVGVDESALLSGSDPLSMAETASNTFTLHAPDGLDSITVGGREILAAELSTLTPSTPIIIPVDNGTLVLTHYDSVTGAVSYTYTLTSTVIEPTDDTVTRTVDLSIKDSDGDTNVGQIQLVITDDTPTALPVDVSMDARSVDTNLMFILDVSGSMADGSGVGGMSRLTLAKQSIADLISQYEALGDVKVMIVTFNSSAQALSTSWVDADSAKMLLTQLSAGGNTDYDAALLTAMNAFGGGGKIGDGQNISYFLSDGKPTDSMDWPSIPGNSSNLGISTAEEGKWEEWLNANDVKSYAFGMGTGLSQSHLQPIAYDGISGAEYPATVVTNLSQLSSLLTATVLQVPLTGNITGSESGILGADGGYIQSITHNGTTYTYDQIAGTVSVSGTDASTFDSSTHILTITTANDAVVAIDLDTGEYSYTAPSVVESSYTDNFGYSVVDMDGDVSGSTAAITVNTDTGTVGVNYFGTDSVNIYTGSSSDDFIYGADGNDTLSGGSGNDYIVGGEGNDRLYGGEGDDTLVSDFRTSGSNLRGDTTLDGGSGFDTLVLSEDDDINFSHLNSANNPISNIEVIDLGSGNHDLTNISINDVVQMTDSNNHLYIVGESGDRVDFLNTEGWVKSAIPVVETINGTTYTFDVYTNDAVDPTVTVKVEQVIQDTI